VSQQPQILVRDAGPEDRAWIEGLLSTSWGSTVIVSRGRVYDASECPALVAVQDGQPTGLATFRFHGDECELLSLEAVRKRSGTGSELLAAVMQRAADSGCRRLWLITTNDNLDAVRFYQRRGMSLVAVHRGAVDEARRIKPSIPEVGEYGIPLHDELEFERQLGAG
jgi:N-acetylglutamate synthase-like GNAT family acetyltransferase